MMRSRVSALDRIANAQSELEQADERIAGVKRDLEYIEDESMLVSGLLGTSVNAEVREKLESITEAARDIRKALG